MPSEEPPIHPIRNMYNQPRYGAQARSEFFEDGRTMRPRVPGTLAHEMEPDLLLATGWQEPRSEEELGHWAMTIPTAVVDRQGGMSSLVARGRGRFDIYCTACHGYGGEGDGMVAERVGGAMKPPSLHSERLRTLPDGQVFATITRGVRNMPAYRHSIPIDDRWAVVSYLRALQLTQVAQAQAMNTGGGKP